jgi:hypothetical protein
MPHLPHFGIRKWFKKKFGRRSHESPQPTQQPSAPSPRPRLTEENLSQAAGRVPPGAPESTARGDDALSLENLRRLDPLSDSQSRRQTRREQRTFRMETWSDRLTSEAQLRSGLEPVHEDQPLVPDPRPTLTPANSEDEVVFTGRLARARPQSEDSEVVYTGRPRGARPQEAQRLRSEESIGHQPLVPGPPLRLTALNLARVPDATQLPRQLQQGSTQASAGASVAPPSVYTERGGTRYVYQREPEAPLRGSSPPPPYTPYATGGRGENFSTSNRRRGGPSSGR